MLSYRHAFHAGNHADVLKHVVLVNLLKYLRLKDKPFWYIDTHAGAGAYDLGSGYAQKLAEYKSGIGRLWGRKDLPQPLAEYIGLLGRLNPDNQLRVYPGSPLFALWSMREQDRLRLFELHGKDARLLQERFDLSGKQVMVEAKDGFSGLKSVLPPPPRRALVLIDPSYEEKQDYERVVFSLRDALERFSSGIYALWYPQLTRLESHELPKRLKRLPVKEWLHVGLRVCTPSKDGYGMHGSAMFILNPPWTLQSELAELMPFLADTLSQGEGSGFVLEHSSQ